jgi:hypothetical protein
VEKCLFLRIGISFFSNVIFNYFFKKNGQQAWHSDKGSIIVVLVMMLQLYFKNFSSVAARK